MAIRWRDVTIPMKEGMAVWPGDAPFICEAKARMSMGDECNISWVSMGVHTGTHIDAPWHFEDDGKRTDQIDTSLFFGPALILDLPEADVITPNLLPDELPARVLFKTRNSQFRADGPFRGDYTALHDAAAQKLVDSGVRLVGIDYLSVGPYQQPGQTTHHRLLRNDVLVVEGLRLAGLSQGMYQFTVLPLALMGVDGSPCRAFVGVEEVCL